MNIVKTELISNMLNYVNENVNIQDNDILWIESKKEIDNDEWENIQNILKENFPKNRIIIVSPGYKLTIEKDFKTITEILKEQGYEIIKKG